MFRSSESLTVAGAFFVAALALGGCEPRTATSPTNVPSTVTGSTAAADAAYCDKLIALYKEYGTGVGESMLGSSENVEAQQAIRECQSGNSAAGIPILERKLTSQRISLPAR
jgi:hypothetical protein